jgi:hypothetical protein
MSGRASRRGTARHAGLHVDSDTSGHTRRRRGRRAAHRRRVLPHSAPRSSQATPAPCSTRAGSRRAAAAEAGHSADEVALHGTVNVVDSVDLPAVEFLPFKPLAVMTLDAADGSSIAQLIEPLLRVALVARHGANYPESVLHRYLAEILERQELMPFAIEGIALAYPDDEDRLLPKNQPNEPLVVVGLLARLVKWRVAGPDRHVAEPQGSVDGSAVRAVFLLLPGSSPTEGLKMKAQIARWRTSGREGTK